MVNGEPSYAPKALPVTLTAQSDQTRRCCDAAPAGQESNRRNCGGLESHLVACGFLFLRLAVSATGSAAAPSPSLTFHSRKVFEQRTRIHQSFALLILGHLCSFCKAKTDLLYGAKQLITAHCRVGVKYLNNKR